MKKLKVSIINNTNSKKIHISVDDGEYKTIPANAEIRTLLRIILNPERYETEITEY